MAKDSEFSPWPPLPPEQQKKSERRLAEPHVSEYERLPSISALRHSPESFNRYWYRHSGRPDSLWHISLRFMILHAAYEHPNTDRAELHRRLLAGYCAAMGLDPSEAATIQITANSWCQWLSSGEPLLPRAWVRPYLESLGVTLPVALPATHAAQKQPGDGQDLAAKLGASKWGDIRLVVRDGGLTFHCKGKHESLDWAALKMPDYLQTLLQQIALRGGTLDPTALHGKAHGNSDSLEQTIAREKANTTRRKYVYELNTRVCDQFPGFKDNPIYNEQGVIKARFMCIEYNT